MQQNPISWFEIPVKNMDRAISFYQKVFETELERNKLGEVDMAWFPMLHNSHGSSGSLVHNPHYYRPSADGIIIYFSAFSGDLQNELSRVEEAGGKVIEPKSLIKKEIGYRGVFIDSEGNRIALHSKF